MVPQLGHWSKSALALVVTPKKDILLVTKHPNFTLMSINLQCPHSLNSDKVLVAGFRWVHRPGVDAVTPVPAELVVAPAVVGAEDPDGLPNRAGDGASLVPADDLHRWDTAVVDGEQLVGARTGVPKAVVLGVDGAHGLPFTSETQEKVCRIFFENYLHCCFCPFSLT